MENNTRVQTLFKTYEMARNLSKFYISKLDGIDLKKQYELDGVKLNTAYWILAHLVWTEHFLIIEGIGGESMGIEWLEDFGFGSSPESVKDGPSIEEIHSRMEEVHNRAIKILNGMNDDQIEEENNIEASFGGSKSKASVLMHAIRHEPMHIGQLSWLLKLNGIKMV